MKMPTTYIDATGKKVRVYDCDVCGKLFEWEHGESQWYGSYAAIEDDPKSCTVVCSECCRRLFEAKE